MDERAARIKRAMESNKSDDLERATRPRGICSLMCSPRSGIPMPSTCLACLGAGRLEPEPPATGFGRGPVESWPSCEACGGTGTSTDSPLNPHRSADGDGKSGPAMQEKRYAAMLRFARPMVKNGDDWQMVQHELLNHFDWLTNSDDHEELTRDVIREIEEEIEVQEWQVQSF